MYRSNPDCLHHRRDGFTLWELVLALAVLAMVVGMTWPAVTRFIGENRLKEDTAELRNQLASTRSRAIRPATLCSVVRASINIRPRAFSASITGRIALADVVNLDPI